MADEQRSTRQLRLTLNAELARLSATEERLIDLAAEGDLPVAEVRSRSTKLSQDRERLREQLDSVEQDLGESADAWRPPCGCSTSPAALPGGWGQHPPAADPDRP